MKTNQHIIKLVYPFSSGSLLNNHCSGAFLNEIRQAALLTIVLGIAVVLATGCESTGKGVSVKLITPVTNSRQAAEADEYDIYQPTRSPAFNEFFGS
jgi:hypothetical protein